MENFIFNENLHKYYLDVLEIPSVTQIISNQIEHVDWNKIPDIEKYRDSGSIVHKNLETYLSGNRLQMDYEQLTEVKNYNSFLKFLKRQGVKIKKIYTERIVHYKNLYAGKFDLLLHTNMGNILVDFKNGEPHKEAVKWQCSMYALALKDQCGIEIEKMFCLGNIGKSKEKFCCLELSRITEENIIKVVDAYNCGYQWNNGGLVEESLRDEVAELLVQKSDLETRLSRLKAKLDEKLVSIKDAMKSTQKKNWNYDSSYGKCSFTITEDYFKNKFDDKRFKQDHEKLYNKYITQTKVSGSFKAVIGE